MQKKIIKLIYTLKKKINLTTIDKPCEENFSQKLLIFLKYQFAFTDSTFLAIAVYLLFQFLLN